ncbi:hypothetical protein Nmel_017782 [Mimus melanotis]
MIARLGENISHSGCSLAPCWRIPCHFVRGYHLRAENRAKQSHVWQVLFCVTLLYFKNKSPYHFPQSSLSETGELTF